MIPIGDIFDLAHKREYQSIPKGIIKGYHTYLNVFKRGCGGKEMVKILVTSFMSQRIIHHDVLDISKFQIICNVSMLA